MLLFVTFNPALLVLTLSSLRCGDGIFLKSHLAHHTLPALWVQMMQAMLLSLDEPHSPEAGALPSSGAGSSTGATAAPCEEPPQQQLWDGGDESSLSDTEDLEAAIRASLEAHAAAAAPATAPAAAPEIPQSSVSPADGRSDAASASNPDIAAAVEVPPDTVPLADGRSDAASASNSGTAVGAASGVQGEGQRSDFRPHPHGSSTPHDREAEPGCGYPRAAALHLTDCAVQVASRSFAFLGPSSETVGRGLLPQTYGRKTFAVSHHHC